MPSKKKHIEQYKKNKSLANSKYMKQTQFKDWRIVIIFYAAMHYLDSSYADVNNHPKTHKKRKEFLDMTPQYDEIIDEYDNLEMLSRKSRYDCIQILDNEVTDALINLTSIEKFVSKLSN